MKYVIVGKNMEVSPSLEKSVKDKLGKLEKFFAEDHQGRRDPLRTEQQ